jgi:hypothetical protein
MNTLRQVTVLTTAFFLVDVGLLAVSFLVWQTFTFIRAAKTAPGRVVDLEWRKGSSGAGVRVLGR